MHTMADTTQQFIDNLITVIYNAEEPESVTNDMVAHVFDYLNKGYKDLLTKNLDAADEAMPRMIDIGGLDTMGTEGGVEALKDFLRTLTYNGPAHTRWAVTTGSGRSSYLVGTLDVFSDQSRHVLTQIFETHHTFTDGVINTGEHTDGAIRRYFRSFNISAPSGFSVAAGEWTPWQECEPESVDELRTQLAALTPKVEALEGRFDSFFEPIAIGGIVAGDEITLSGTSGGLSTADGSSVVYDTTGRLLLRVATRLPGVYSYYGDWADATDYGEVDIESKRIVPFEKRIPGACIIGTEPAL